MVSRRSRLLRGRLHSEQTPAAGLFKSAPRAPLKTSCLARYAFELRVFPNRRERRVALDRAQRRESLLLRAGQHFGAMVRGHRFVQQTAVPQYLDQTREGFGWGPSKAGIRYSPPIGSGSAEPNAGSTTRFQRCTTWKTPR